jgi:hypothetical protein
MELLDRLALLVTPKRRCLDWIGSLPNAPRSAGTYDSKSLRTIYLVAAHDGEVNLEDLIDEYSAEIFEHILIGWTDDESLWPKNRTPHVFRDWCHVELVDLAWDADPAEPLLVSEAVRTQCANCEGPLEDHPVYVGIGADGTRRLTSDEFDEYERQRDAAPYDPVSMIVLRCCGNDCASDVETVYAGGLDARRQRQEER